jgi:type VI secretion system secreted protein Hcp
VAGDCFILIDQVTGEAHDKDFAGAIDVSGWNWGANARVDMSSTKGPRGAADVHMFEFRHSLDTASAGLLSRCVNNAVLPSAVLTMRRAGGLKAQVYLEITFKKVRIVRVAHVFSTDALIPAETVSIAFESVSFDYTPQSSQGSDKSGKNNFSWIAPATT